MALFIDSDEARLKEAFRLLVSTLRAALTITLATGCGGSRSPSSPDVGKVADWNLPRVRSVAAHPDSLRQLTITEEADQIRLELAQSYEQLYRSWSSTFQFVSPNREIQNPLTLRHPWEQRALAGGTSGGKRHRVTPKRQGPRAHYAAAEGIPRDGTN